MLQILHKRRQEIAAQIKTETERHTQELGKLLIELQNTNELIAQNAAGLDNERIQLAEDCIKVTGWEYVGLKHDRGDLDGCIQDAINDISKGVDKMRREYFGCKNYEGFFLQRADCEYGYKPTHGGTAFSIGLGNHGRGRDIDRDRQFTPQELDAMIYYLTNLLPIGQARAAASNTPEAKAALRG